MKFDRAEAYFEDLWRAYQVDRLLEEADGARASAPGALLHVCGLFEIGFKTASVADPEGKRLGRLISSVRKLPGMRSSQQYVLVRDLLTRTGGPSLAYAAVKPDWFARLVTLDASYLHRDIHWFSDGRLGKQPDHYSEAYAVASDRDLLMEALAAPPSERNNAQTTVASLESYLLFCVELAGLMDDCGDLDLASATFELYRDMFEDALRTNLPLAQAAFGAMSGGSATLGDIPELMALNRLIERHGLSLRNYSYWSAADAQLREFLQSQSETHSRASTLASRVDIMQAFVQPSLVDDTAQTIDYQQVLHLIRTRSSGIFVVSGDAGSGKTWLLKKIALDLIRDNSEARNEDRFLVPIYLPARLVSADLSPLPAISQITGLSPEVVGYALDRFQCILLLDGLDEVAPSVRLALEDFVYSLQNKYHGLVCIATGRHSTSRPFEGHSTRRLSIGRMSEEQTRSMLSRITPSYLHKRMDSFLSSRDFSALANPLLASLVPELLERSSEVPATHDQFMSETLTALLSRQDATKSTFRRESTLSLNERTDLVSVTCLLMLIEKSHRITEVELAVLIGKSLQLLGFGMQEPGTLVRELLESGFFVEEGGSVRFLHRSLFEFCAAKGASRLLRSPQQMAKLLVEGDIDQDFARSALSEWSRSGKEMAELRALVLASDKPPGWLVELVDQIQRGLPPKTALADLLDKLD